MSREDLYGVRTRVWSAFLVGRIAVIRLALYGLKSSGFAWRSHLAETLRSCDFTMCYADNDVWMRPAEKVDGTKSFEYVLVYTDDILVVSIIY